MIPCQLPEFRQCIDHTRPFELLDQDAYGRPTTVAPERRPHLRYRYTDNGEIAVVPHTHYNLTPQARARWWRAPQSAASVDSTASINAVACVVDETSVEAVEAARRERG
jgi:hypothetical protein